MRRPTIRPATPVDRADLAGLWLALVDHHRGLDPGYHVGAGLRAAVMSEIDRGLGDDACAIRVAEAEGALVGVLFCEHGASGNLDDPGQCWIHELFVTGEWRRTGVGTALVDAAFAFFRERGGGRLAVRVEEGNAAARRFWEGRGYRARARILEREL